MVNKATPELRLAAGYADALLREKGIDQFPVDPRQLAEDAGITVLELPAGTDGCSGMLIHRGGAFGIMYSTAVDSAGYQRFSIAHELGHYYLPGHPDAVLRDGQHSSMAGYVSADAYEREADQFAAELVLPERLVRPVLGRLEDGMQSVRGLAEAAIASLSASGIAYARYTRSAVAVVMSTGGRVEFCSFSDALKDARVGWLKRGDAVPATSLTSELHRAPDRILAAESLSGETSLTHWFGSDRKLTVVEEAVGLGRYGKVLTILHVPGLTSSDEGLETDEQEEAALLESWTPRFHR